jgi:nucleoside diphosphate kinase
LNPLLGINETGKRIMIYDVVKKGEIPKVMDYIHATGYKVKTFWVPPDGKFNLVLHLETDDVNKIISDLEKMGFKAEAREFTVKD